MSGMFEMAKSFNQDISSWNVSKVHFFMNMFHGASSFNQNLDNWIPSNVIITTDMFTGTVLENNPPAWSIK